MEEDNNVVQYHNSFALLPSDSSLDNEVITPNVEPKLQEVNQIEMEVRQVKKKIENKRKIEEDSSEKEIEPDWNTVKSKEKKFKVEIIEMYVTCNEKMPKLFSFAKALKNNNILAIQNIKFINPFKIRVDVTSEESASNLETCQEFLDKGWRIHRAMEKNLSFGVIKNVDLDMEEGEIVKNISCPGKVELLSAYRLKRRYKDDEEEGWKPSESVRLCFKGSLLPNYVNVDGIHIRVEPYVFPVSQCANCWRLGHVTKRCPSNKKICPKCAGEHANCETQRYKCINCGGRHMAMAKKECPSFLKEKRLRDIMAEFNCTYRRALTMYVEPQPPEPPQSDKTILKEEIPSMHYSNLFPECFRPDKPAETSMSSNTPMYAEVVKTRAVVHEESKRTRRPATRKSRQSATPLRWADDPGSDTPSEPTETKEEKLQEKNKSERSSLVENLLQRLKEIIFVKGASIQSKLKMVFKCCAECVVFFLVDFLPDWPILQFIIDFMRQDG